MGFRQKNTFIFSLIFLFFYIPLASPEITRKLTVEDDGTTVSSRVLIIDFQAGVDATTSSGGRQANITLDTGGTQLLNYLRSDASDSYTSGTLTINAGTELAISGTLKILNSSSSTVSASGQIAIDTNGMASSHGSLEFHDGTQVLHGVGTTDTPADNEVPKFDSGTGKITWEADAGGSGTIDGGGSGTHVTFWSDADTLDTSPSFTFTKGTARLDLTGSQFVSQLNVGGTDFSQHTLEVNGHVGIDRTADAAGQHTLELDVDASGFGDFTGINLIYTTGAFGAETDGTGILVNVINTTANVASTVHGIQVLNVGGSGTVVGLEVGAEVSPVVQLSGVFEDPDSFLSNAVDVLGSVIIQGSNPVTIFAADNDTVTIGNTAKFENISFLLSTVASGAGIFQGTDPRFEHSITGPSFEEFTPTDGTSGFENSGVIAFEDSDIPTWVVDGDSRFTIRITRTRNNVTTDPVVDFVQISAATEFEWDTGGSLTINQVLLESDGVRLSADNDGALTIAGLGNGSDEDWNINLDDTANTVVHGTSTGVTLHDWETIDLATDALDLSEGNITNVGDIALDSISPDVGGSINMKGDLEVNGSQIGLATDPDLLSLASTILTVNGSLLADTLEIGPTTSGATATIWSTSGVGLLLDGLGTGSANPGAEAIALFIKSNSDDHAIHIEETNGGEDWQLGVNPDGGLLFFNSEGANPTVTFSDAGLVGMGTETPREQLEIKTADGTSVDFLLSEADTLGWRFRNNQTGNALTIASTTDFSAYTSRMTITTGGNVTFNSGTVSIVGNTGNVALTIASTDATTDVDIKDSATTELTALRRIGNNLSLIPDGDGNVAIGTTTASEKLHVLGDFLVEDATPHIEWRDTNGDNFEAYADGSQWILQNLTDTKNYIRIDADHNINLIQATDVESDLTVSGTFKVGSPPDVAYNAISDSATATKAVISDGNDLFIAGDLEVDGTIFAPAVVDTSDLAEFFYSEEALEPGEVVVLVPNKPYWVKRSIKAYDHHVIGVVSTKPGHMLGAERMEGGFPVGIAGTLPVRVEGVVESGDLLVSSKIPGYARSAFNAMDLFYAPRGTVIGKALLDQSS